MKPRQTPVTAPPNSSRYWTTDVPGQGEHVWRHPFYGVGSKLLTYAKAGHVDPEEDTRSPQDRYADLLPVAGTFLGFCWWHPTMVLDAPTPTVYDHATLTAYGLAVAEELQEAGWTMLDIVTGFGAVMEEFNRRQSLVAQAEQRARFFAPPMEDSTSS